MAEQVVHLWGVFNGMSGYSVHAIQFFRALSRHRRVLTSYEFWPQERLQQVKDQLWQLAGEGASIVNICLAPLPHAVHLAPYPGWKVGYAVWESTVLEEAWKQAACGLDRIWTATHWNKQVFVDNGISADKVDVVPEGIDPVVFNPHGGKFPQLAGDSRLKFLVVGKYEERKCTPQLIRAFDEEFHRESDVALVLICDNLFVRDFDLRRELQGLGLKNPNNIIDGRWVPDTDTLAAIYRSCDAFLAPTRAEGWGLPIGEAMASGLTTVVTDYSGPTEFTTGDTALLLDYTLHPIPPNAFVRADPPGLWATPDFQQFRRHLRWIKEHRPQAQAIGQQAARHMADHWTWDHAARKAVGVMEKLFADR
ncbi:MAG: glycosyltransferase family 4 protein [Magnetococcales bacterium]|nr:glycosyltransferase family 4 protein [Magnetococcales bacterium]NGZ28190.1 glycosyltransferase family 4 protein [Magnetococcales bacterium]